MKIQRDLIDRSSETLEQFPSALQVLLESIQAFLVPTRQHLLRAAIDERHVHLDLRGLSDPVKTSDPLLQQLRRERKIKQHEVVRKLEVPAFAANFRTDQNAGSMFFREPCGIA